VSIPPLFRFHSFSVQDPFYFVFVPFLFHSGYIPSLIRPASVSFRPVSVPLRPLCVPFQTVSFPFRFLIQMQFVLRSAFRWCQFGLFRFGFLSFYIHFDFVPFPVGFLSLLFSIPFRFRSYLVLFRHSSVSDVSDSVPIVSIPSLFRFYYFSVSDPLYFLFVVYLFRSSSVPFSIRTVPLRLFCSVQFPLGSITLQFPLLFLIQFHFVFRFDCAGYFPLDSVSSLLFPFVFSSVFRLDPFLFRFISHLLSILFVCFHSVYVLFCRVSIPLPFGPFWLGFGYLLYRIRFCYAPFRFLSVLSPICSIFFPSRLRSDPFRFNFPSVSLVPFRVSLRLRWAFVWFFGTPILLFLFPFRFRSLSGLRSLSFSFLFRFLFVRYYSVTVPFFMVFGFGSDHSDSIFFSF